MVVALVHDFLSQHRRFHALLRRAQASAEFCNELCARVGLEAGTVGGLVRDALGRAGSGGFVRDALGHVSSTGWDLFERAIDKEQRWKQNIETEYERRRQADDSDWEEWYDYDDECEPSLDECGGDLTRAFPLTGANADIMRDRHNPPEVRLIISFAFVVARHVMPRQLRKLPRQRQHLLVRSAPAGEWLERICAASFGGSFLAGS